MELVMTKSMDLNVNVCLDSLESSVKSTSMNVNPILVKMKQLAMILTTDMNVNVWLDMKVRLELS